MMIRRRKKRKKKNGDENMGILDKLKPSKDYEVKKSLKKFWNTLGIVIVLAALAASIEYLSGIKGLEPLEMLWLGLAIAILEAVRNALKHWKEENEEE